MNALLDLASRLAAALNHASGAVIGTLARVLFAGVLFVYYWGSALTKTGDGLFGIFKLDTGVYIQMFPRAFETAGYDPQNLGLYYKVVALLGTWAEFVLPVLIVIGLFTRLAALGMIGFVIVQTLTDVVFAAHASWGAWFDRTAEFDPTLSGVGLIDTRGFWIFTLLVLVMKGPGPLSVDALLFRRRAPEPLPA